MGYLYREYKLWPLKALEFPCEVKAVGPVIEPLAKEIFESHPFRILVS